MTTSPPGSGASDRWNLNGLELEVLKCGSGAPLLALHGPNPFAHDAPFLGLLGRHREVFAPSHPGFGNSPRPEDFDTVYDLVHLYLEMIDRLPGGNITLMGFSFGGWLAAEIAAHCSHRLEHLILVDPVGIKVGDRETRDISHFFNTHPVELNRRAWHEPTSRPKGTHGLGWQLDVNVLGDGDLITRARNMDSLSVYAWRPHMYNPQLKRWLHRIRVPTLLVWGASDQIVTAAYGQAYRDLIPGARMQVIARAGHHPEIEQPEAFVALVLGFLESGSQPQAPKVTPEEANDIHSQNCECSGEAAGIASPLCSHNSGDCLRSRSCAD